MFKLNSTFLSRAGTTAGLRKGDKASIWDLLHGMMLPSGNDAAHALAEFVGRKIFIRTEEYRRRIEENPGENNCKSKDSFRMFINEMNKTAREIGLANTQYANPHGLANRFNRSCSNDIAKLTAIAMQRCTYFRQIVKTKSYKCAIRSQSNSFREIEWVNTNLLLEQNECLGVKTGITPTAGPCLCTYWQREHSSIIIVILRTASMELRWLESLKLAEWGFQLLQTPTQSHISSTHSQFGAALNNQNGSLILNSLLQNQKDRIVQEIMNFTKEQDSAEKVEQV